MPRMIQLLACAALLARPAAAQDFAWHGDLDAARRLAAKENKPLLLLFRCEP